MDTVETLNKYLPLERINKILYEHKGLAHPAALIIKDHWDQMDAKYGIYLNIEHIITRRHIQQHDDSFITIVTEETFEEYLQDYPRLNFIVDYDFIDTITYEEYDFEL